MRITTFIILFALTMLARAAEPLPTLAGRISTRPDRVTFEVPAPASTPDLSDAFPAKPGFGVSGGSLGGATRSNSAVVMKSAIAQTTPEMIEHHSKTATELLRSIMNGNSKAFVFWGTERFKGYKPEKFQELVSLWSSPLAGGWSVAYLGELKRGAAVTTVWRVQFFDRSPEGLLTLATDKKGSVESFGLY